jgi:endonuclease-3
MDSMGNIIEKMEKVLYDKKPYRFTALKQLQAEESGDPFKILIGTILSIL